MHLFTSTVFHPFKALILLRWIFDLVEQQIHVKAAIALNKMEAHLYGSFECLRHRLSKVVEATLFLTLFTYAAVAETTAIAYIKTNKDFAGAQAVWIRGKRWNRKIIGIPHRKLIPIYH